MNLQTLLPPPIGVKQPKFAQFGGGVHHGAGGIAETVVVSFNGENSVNAKTIPPINDVIRENFARKFVFVIIIYSFLKWLKD